MTLSRALVALGSLAGLCACAGLSKTLIAHACQPIDLALSAPMDQMRAAADHGDALSQYALSIVDRYGLRGAPVDVGAADVWLGRSLKPRGYTPLTSYMAGLNGRPGRVISIVVPRYDLPNFEDTLIRRCLNLLAGAEASSRLDAALSAGACGGAANYGRLETAWLAAAPKVVGP